MRQPEDTPQDRPPDDEPADRLDTWLAAFLDGRRAPAHVYAPRAVTWHAATGAETPVVVDDGSEPSFARLRRAVPDLRREDVRVERFDGGLLLQSTTVGTVDGAEVRVAACLVVRLDDEGRVARFEEYADRQAAAALAGALA